MKYTISDKIIAYMTLISGLIISAVAIYYSVAGLVAIFAAAAVPIMIMGGVLEGSKLVATVWLKRNWSRAPFLIKTYLLTAIVILMLITSMGIFGFLSKAHLDQTVPTGDVQSQVALIDEKINNERETISNARILLGQLDKAVSDISSAPDREVNGRIISSAERALQVRRQQARDRASLTKTIEEAQARIVKLQEEKAPIASQLRAVEAEVGPIKYIAKLIYGDNTDQNLLEKAVTWVIIIIVLVFDPLAVILLLASQTSFQWFRQEEEERKNELVQTQSNNEENAPEATTTLESDDREDNGNDTTTSTIDRDLAEEANQKIAEIEREIDIDATLASLPEEVEVKKDPLTEWNEMIEEAERAVIKEKSFTNVIWTDNLRAWKEQNPNSDIYQIQRSFDAGEIATLPWEQETVDPVAEAQRWAEEQQEESKKKTTYIIKQGDQQIQKTKD